MDLGLPPLDQSSNGPWLVWSSWVLVGLSATFICLRCYCRVTFNRSLWWDDYVLILSWIMLLSSTIDVTYIVTQGFGRHVYNVDPEKLPMVGLLAQVVLIFAVLAAAWSKTSWGITMLRLCGSGKLHYVVLFIIISLNVTMGLSIVLNFIQCIPSRKLWEPYLEGACWPSQAVPIYTTISGVYSGFMDIALALLPWTLIMKTNMRLAEKIGVALAMSCGLVAGAMSFVKSSHVMSLGSKDPIFDVAPLIVWGHGEIAATIIAASIPVMRVFVKNVSLSFSRSWRQMTSQANSTWFKSGASSSGSRADSQWRPKNPHSKGNTTMTSSSTMMTTIGPVAPSDMKHNDHNNNSSNNYHDKEHDGAFADTFSVSGSQLSRGMSRDDSSERAILPTVPESTLI